MIFQMWRTDDKGAVFHGSVGWMIFQARSGVIGGVQRAGATAPKEMFLVRLVS